MSIPTSDVAVGVRSELPSGFVRLARLLVEFLFWRDDHAEIIRTAYIGLRKAGGTLGDRAIANHFLRCPARRSPT